jgi:hypothetical protein
MTEFRQAEALRLQLAGIAGNEPPSSFLEVRPLGRDGRPALSARRFVPVRELDRAIEHIREAAARLNVFVGAAPRVSEDGTAAAVERVWTLWADLDGPAALARVSSFDPTPSIVVRTGSPDHAHAWWPLREPIPPAWAVLANRRLARRLGADLKATDSARVLRPCSTLNFKHDPPRPVICTRLELDVFTVAQVVRGLPDDRTYTALSPLRRMPAPALGDLLEPLVRAVERAEVGERNELLYWAACRAFEHVRVGEAEGGEARDRLRDAAIGTGLAEGEVEATLRSAAAEVGAAA